MWEREKPQSVLQRIADTKEFWGDHSQFYAGSESVKEFCSLGHLQDHWGDFLCNTQGTVVPLLL
jgi:hypothetical protein